jgi:hypothetical protein
VRGVGDGRGEGIGGHRPILPGAARRPGTGSPDQVVSPWVHMTVTIRGHHDHRDDER